MLARRESSRPPVTRPEAYVAQGPGEVWSWDITYLPSVVRGSFFYLYLVDIWSRKIVGWAVHEQESAAHGARLIDEAARALGIERHRLVLHSDNGGPMKASTMLATLQRLGIVPSFSRPHQSNDNPFSESLFRTAKYRPDYPSRPFASLKAARTWVADFVRWYNTKHIRRIRRLEEALRPRRREAGGLGIVVCCTRPAWGGFIMATHRGFRRGSPPGAVHGQAIPARAT